MKLTHKAVVLMCGYKIITQYRNPDGSYWSGGSGKHMYNVSNKHENELSVWSADCEHTCKLFCEHYGFVEKS